MAVPGRARTTTVSIFLVDPGRPLLQLLQHAYVCRTVCPYKQMFAKSREREKERGRERESLEGQKMSERLWLLAEESMMSIGPRAWILLVAALLIFMVPEWEVLDQSYLAGEYYSVNPVAINNPKVDVLTENCRSVTQLELAPGIHNILIILYVCIYI
jgi:hypothetical protein